LALGEFPRPATASATNCILASHSDPSPPKRERTGSCSKRGAGIRHRNRPAVFWPTPRPSRSAGARSSRELPTSGWPRTGRVPWVGRNEDRSDSTVWAVTCLLTRAGFRGKRGKPDTRSRVGSVRPNQRSSRAQGLPHGDGGTDGGTSRWPVACIRRRRLHRGRASDHGRWEDDYRAEVPVQYLGEAA
jgi:hypothetical protein